MLEFRLSSKELPGLIELLKGYSEMMNENIRDVFEMVLREIEAAAKKNSPVDTGRLRADIGTKFNRREMEGIVYNIVEYSIYVHEGTYKMRARPYILNAIHNIGESKIQRELERNLLKDRRGLG
jgi:HK97 gp10 family phage protein